MDDPFAVLLAAALDQRLAVHPEWEPETVRNILTVVQKPMYGARSIEAIAAAWPRFAAEPGALLHSFPSKSGAWWIPLSVEPLVSARAQLEPAPSTIVVTMTPTPPEHGVDTTVEDFLPPAELGALADPPRQPKVSPAIPPGAEFARLIAVEREATERRLAAAVSLVLDEGWSYARLGRALGISRQAAAKTYGQHVEAELRKRVTRGGAAAARSRQGEP
jgi:hypothetical protein